MNRSIQQIVEKYGVPSFIDVISMTWEPLLLGSGTTAGNQASPLLVGDILEELYHFSVSGAHFIILHAG